jgi:predicted CXXCH cytochrome family protein
VALRTSITALALLLPALVALDARGSQSTPSSPDATALGAERCVDCHAATVASYARTGMARALGPIEAGELAGLGPVPAGETGYRYHFEGARKPGAEGGLPAWIVESFGEPQSPEHVRSAAQLAFAVGAGDLDRSYVALQHGRWWFAPLEVLSAAGEKPRHAELAPGHSIQPLLRLESPIGEECLACHTDRPPPRGYPLNLEPAAAAGWTPRGISCAACHGDVDAHADWREQELAGHRPAGADPVLQHRSLDLEQRLSVCARCHLQGDARVALTPGERGVPPPGGDFLDRWAVFVPRVPDDDVAFVSHVERLVASPCYLGSRDERDPRAGLSCETCHDPHRPTSDERERLRVRSACLECHAVERSPAEPDGCSLPLAERSARDCVDCHMPTTAVFDVGHVRIHDHRIARQPAPAQSYESLRVQHSTDGDLSVFAWPGRARQEYAEDPGLAMMAAVIARFPQRALALVDREPAPSVSALATYHHLRGVLLEQLERPADAAQAYGAALSRDREQIDSAVNLSLVLGRLGRVDDGIELATRVLERHPRAEGALRNRALLRLSAGDEAGFAADLAAAHGHFPRAAVARALADWARRDGDTARADELEDQARRLAPHEARSR